MPPRTKESISDADLSLIEVTKISPRVQVILDVGAQNLELSNLEVARKWLELLRQHDREAVIFFNDSDELSVIDRKGIIEPL
jgi:hypothetical protein